MERAHLLLILRVTKLAGVVWIASLALAYLFSNSTVGKFSTYWDYLWAIFLVAILFQIIDVIIEETEPDSEEE